MIRAINRTRNGNPLQNGYVERYGLKGDHMPRVLALLLLASMAACTTFPEATDPSSDAPEVQRRPVASFKDAASYQQALQVWRTPEDVNAWIGARFDYDLSRAMLLSETQRSRSGQLPIYQPQAFFAVPSGV